MPTLQVVDPPMCCMTGVCGDQNDRALRQFASDLQWLRMHGITVERHNAAEGIDDVADETAARVASRFLHEFGEDALPLFVVDGNVLHYGTYPSRGLLMDLVGVEAASGDGTGNSFDVVELAEAVSGKTTTRAARRAAWDAAAKEETISRRSVLSKIASGIFAGLVAP
ncbi:MAG: arsenic metallochaperone ArsD family protein, partial [Rhodothermales bacterium]